MLTRLSPPPALKMGPFTCCFLLSFIREDPATLGLFPGGLDEDVVRVIWKQMLKAVQAMHDQRVSLHMHNTARGQGRLGSLRNII